MKQEFSTSWKSSKQPRKQRKYRYNAPLHIKGKFLNVHLSKDLKKKYNKRSIRIRKGDTVKVMKGQFKKISGKIVNVNLRKCKVTIENVQHIRRDGTKSYYPIYPSNLMITSLNLDDKKRKIKLEQNMKKEK
ncbi:MAG: 50S ribosomal protein L24 [Candidatus Nanoarchaeia archaeon]|nr:50S ribosomal protein L24 [Candidatus Nanoarchaeia archaeon]MDD5587726.1 50S ribosomal protein L24 [Candidatus Nanoarchaeia archaeon]